MAHTTEHILGQMELKLTNSNLSGNTISNTWQLRKLLVDKGFPQGGQFLTLVITLKNSQGVVQNYKGFEFRFPTHIFSSGRQSAIPQPPSTENTVIQFNKENYPNGVIELTGQLYQWDPDSTQTFEGTTAYKGSAWSYPITTTLNFETKTETSPITEQISSILESFQILPEAAAEPMPIHSRIDTSIKQSFVNMKINKNDHIEGRIDFTALGFNEYFKAGQPITNIFVIKNINGVQLGMFLESYLKFGKSETLDMIEHRDIIGFSAYNQNQLIIESYVQTANQIVLSSMITQKIVKETPTLEPKLTTTNFQVKLNNTLQFTSSLSNADYKRLQDEMSQEPKITLVFLNQTDSRPISTFYEQLRNIQKLLEGQVVETTGPTGEVIITTTVLLSLTSFFLPHMISDKAT